MISRVLGEERTKMRGGKIYLFLSFEIEGE